MQIKCDFCGNLINKKRYKKSNHCFCNLECRQKFYRHEVKCDNCGKIIKKCRSDIKKAKHHFCNRECKRKFQIKQSSAEIKCFFCGKIIFRTKYRIQKAKRHFCSRKCHYNYKRIEKKCEYCGKVFKRTISFLKRSKKHFCNNKCFQNFRANNRYKTNCDYCGSIILKNKSRFKSPVHFCNEKCRRKFERKEIKCAYCGKIIEKTISQLRDHKNHFCGRKCLCKWKSVHYKGKNSPNWKGGIANEPYPFEFNDDLKESVRKRDDYVCQYPACEARQNGKAFCVHHIDYNKKNIDPLNLITFCNKHNAKVNYNREYWKEYFQNEV